MSGPLIYWKEGIAGKPSQKLYSTVLQWPGVTQKWECSIHFLFLFSISFLYSPSFSGGACFISLWLLSPVQALLCGPKPTQAEGAHGAQVIQGRSEWQGTVWPGSPGSVPVYTCCPAYLLITTTLQSVLVWIISFTVTQVKGIQSIWITLKDLNTHVRIKGLQT